MERHLRAKNRSEATIEFYLILGAGLVTWLQAEELSTDHTSITRATLERYLAAMHEGVAPARRRASPLPPTAVSLAGRRRELERSPMETMSPPAVFEQPVSVLDLDELGRLVKTCAGNTFEDPRDNAVIRLFLDTGMRAGELAALTWRTLTGSRRRLRHG